MLQRRIRVLAIDDEIAFMRLLKINLERSGRYDVCCESDSRRALGTARAFKPDVILLDVVMPGLDGGDLLDIFRSDRQLQDVPVIILTALIRVSESEGHAVTGGDGVEMLSKPARIGALCRSIERQLRQSVARRS